MHMVCEDDKQVVKLTTFKLYDSEEVATDARDNLLKFLLDGLNKLVCEDDRQIGRLGVSELCDSEGECNGRTVVRVTKLNCLPVGS